MKSISKFLMICGIASVMSFSAEAHKRVTVIHNKYAHKGDSVYVEMTIDLNNADIPKNAYVLLTPVIKMDEMLKELPTVIINGTNRVTAYRRLVALRREPVGAGMVINMGEKDTPQTHDYSIVLPFEPWMHEANFTIREDQCDCNGPLVQMSFDLIVGRMHDINPLNLSISYKEPNPEPVKHRYESGKTYLDFMVNSYILNPYYRNNAAELAKIGDMLLKARYEPSITITGVILDGYASPEGSYKSNLILSEKRAASLKEYLQKKYKINSSMFKLQGHGEDWETLVELIKDSHVLYGSDVLEIIFSTEDVELREKRLRNLDAGVPYEDMLTYFYPKLRRLDYELQYTVLPFTIEEGKEKLESNPSLLSLNEMFLIAETYPTGSYEFQRIFEIAVALYPVSDIANFNAGANALSVKNLNDAKKYMDLVVSRDPAFDNNLGVLLAMQGKHEEAAGYFWRAAEGGNQEAIKNLTEVEKVNPWTVKILTPVEKIGTSSIMRKPTNF